MAARGLANTTGVTGGWRDSERGESWDGSVYGSGDTEGGGSDGSSEETEDEETEPEDEKIRSSRRNTRFSTSTTQAICFSRSSTHSDREQTCSPPVRRTRSSVKIERASSRHRYRTRGKATFKTEPAITTCTRSATSRSCTVPRAARHTRLKQELKRTTRNSNPGHMAMAPALTKQYTLRSRRSQTFVTKSDDESGDGCSEDDADDEDEDEDGSGSSEGDEGGESEDSMEDTIVIARPPVFASLGEGGGTGAGTGAGGGAFGAGTGGAGCGASCEEDEDGSEEEHSEEQEEHTSYFPGTGMHEDAIPDDQDAAMNNPASSLPDAPLTMEEEGSSQDTMARVRTAPQPTPHATESVSGESGLDGGIDVAAANGTVRSSTLSGNDMDDDIGSTHRLQPSPQVQPLLVEPRYALPPLPDEDADADADRDAQATAARGGRYDRVVPDSEADTSDAWTAMDICGEWEDGHFAAPRIVVMRAFEHVAPLSPGHQPPGTPGHPNASSSGTPPALGNAGRESTLQRGSARSITNAPRPAASAAAGSAYEDEGEWSNMGETMVSEGGLSPADEVPTGSLEGYAAAGGGGDAEETETEIAWDLQGDATVSEGWWPAAVPEEHSAGLSGEWVLYTSPNSTPTDDTRGGGSIDDEEEEEEKAGSGDDSVGDVRAAEMRANAFVDIAMQRAHRSSTGSYITARDISPDGEDHVSAADGQCLLQQGEDRLAEGADRRSVPVDTAPGDDDGDEILTRWRKRKRALRHPSTRSNSSGSGGSESPTWHHFTGDSQEKEKLGGTGEEAPQWEGQWQWPCTGLQPAQGDPWNGGIEGQREPIVERQAYMDGLRMGMVDGEGEGDGEDSRESGAGALDARLWEWYGSVTGTVTVRELEVRVERIVGGRHLPHGWLQGWVVRRGVSVREERGRSLEYPICLDDDEE